MSPLQICIRGLVLLALTERWVAGLAQSLLVERDAGVRAAVVTVVMVAICYMNLVLLVVTLGRPSVARIRDSSACSLKYLSRVVGAVRLGSGVVVLVLEGGVEPGVGILLICTNVG